MGYPLMSMRVRAKEQMWMYRIGLNYVVLSAPDKQRYIVPFNELLGYSWREISALRRQGCKTPDALGVTRHKIRDHIESRLH